MRRRMLVGAWLCVVAAACALSAQEDTVSKAMHDELARSMEQLRIERLDRPYFIAYRVEERDDTNVSASFGALLGSHRRRTRFLTVELRVGDYALDNTNFFSPSFNFSGVMHTWGGTVQLPLEDDYKEIRRQMWLATDSAYKKTLEDLSGKRAALQNKTRTEEIPDFSKENPTTTTDEAAPVDVRLSEAETMVRELSALFRAMPDVFTSTVLLRAGTMHTRYINSEGTSFTTTRPEVMLIARAHTQAADGMPLEDFVTHYGHSFADLRQKERLAAQIREMGARLHGARTAPMLQRYNGPVLFEDRAAAELFSLVFAPRLLAVRRPVMGNPQFEFAVERSQAGETSFVDKLGGRVLPESFNVVDSPALTTYGKHRLWGGYRVDDEGVRARETILVQNGILKTLLATRTPVGDISHSTGNFRGAGPVASNLLMTTDKGLTSEEMKRELLRLVKQRGKEYGIVVRRLSTPSLDTLFDTMSVMFFAGQQRTERESILVAYKVYSDGREELVRGAELSDLNTASFKDIVAASKGSEAYSAPFSSRTVLPFSLGFGWHDFDAPIVSYAVPSLLFDDLALTKPTTEFLNPPASRNPFFDK